MYMDRTTIGSKIKDHKTLRHLKVNPALKMYATINTSIDLYGLNILLINIICSFTLSGLSR